MTTSPAGSIAPLARRAFACLIDGAIAALLMVVGYGATLATALPGLTPQNITARAGGLVLGLGATLLVALVWFIVFCVMQGGGGSVGMRIMKLRLVRADTGARLGFGRALLRNIVFGLSTAILVGYFSPLFDGSGLFQGWHDKASGAIALDVRGVAAPVAPASSAPVSSVSIAPVAPVSHARAAGVAPVEAWDDPDGATVMSIPPRPVDPGPPAVAAAVAPKPIDDLAEQAMITMVPGISPAVPVPVPTPVTGPEAAHGSAIPAAAPLPAPPAAVRDTEDDDPEDTRISIPGHRLLFVWDDGARAVVSGRTVFGRNPSAEPGAAAVAVRDETLSLSKTHFEAAAENAGGWVRDRHSTNGTTIVRDGVRIACPAGERVRIRLGDAIEIGERIVTVGGYT